MLLDHASMLRSVSQFKAEEAGTMQTPSDSRDNEALEASEQ
jgi:hypothetical protein